MKVEEYFELTKTAAGRKTVSKIGKRNLKKILRKRKKSGFYSTENMEVGKETIREVFKEFNIFLP